MAFEDAIDLAGVALIFMPEVIGSGIAQGPRNYRQFSFVARQPVNLSVVRHLQLILNVPQENVGLRESVVFFAGEKTLFAQCSEPSQRVPLPDLRRLPAIANLEALGDKFDFANTAGAQLHVATALVTEDHLLVDLAFHAANISQGCGVELPVINEWPHHVEKCSA